MAIIKCPKCGRQISDKGGVCPGCMTPLSELLRKSTVVQSMNTAEGLYNYCQENGLGSGVSKNWDLKHFQLITDALNPDEAVFTAFIGLHNFVSSAKHDGNFAYAVTNKRFILAQKKMIGSVLQTVSLENINDITFQKKMLFGIINVDTIRETFNVAANFVEAERIHKAIQNALTQVKIKSGNMQTVDFGDMATQLSELKNLLNAGLITARDYEAKKKQLLGL